MRIFVNNVDGFLAGAICADLWKLSNTILGTRKKHDGGLVPPCIKRLVMRTDVRKLLKAVASCDVVVYDLHDADMEELELVLRALHSSEIQHSMTFIIVSSVGVWSRTQRTYETPEVQPEECAPATGDVEAAAVDGDTEVCAVDADAEGTGNSGVEPSVPVRRPVPLKSEDYTRRIPAPKFQEWKAIETTALALREKGTVRPYIVCSGVPYGNGEEAFLSLFKAAWQSKDTLRVIGDGNNFIPCVHARDCARLVRRIVETKPDLEYHLAVDRGDVTQKDIVQAVASEFSLSYDVSSVSVPEALLAELADMLTLDLRLEPSPIMERTKVEEPPPAESTEEAPAEAVAAQQPPAAERRSSSKGLIAAEEEQPEVSHNLSVQTIKPPANFRWWSEKGIVANISVLVSEFCRWRRLKPVRMIILGPPGSGAGKLVKLMAQRYGLEAAAMDDVVERLSNTESELGHAVHNMLNEITAAFSNPKAQGPFQMSTALLTQIIEEDILPKASSRFRGFVLSGFPASVEEGGFFLEEPHVEAVAAAETEDSSQPPPEEKRPEKVFKPSLAPDIVVVLSSSEEACQSRAQDRMPEKEFAQKMAKWKEAMPEEGPKLTDVFNDRGIVPLTLEVDEVSEDDLCDQIAAHLENVRPIFNFRVPQAKHGTENKEQAMEAEPAQDESAAQKEAEGKRKKTEEKERIESIKKEEFARLEKHSETLRQYLMQFVVPTLTTGLIDVCRETPDDPIAYLAEYLSSYSTEMVNARRRKRLTVASSPPASS